MTAQRLYQLSLRTVFEATFVVAVILAFVTWRNMPGSAAGRYQVQPLSSERVLFIDTATGKMWRGYLSDGKWEQVSTPVSKSK